MDQRPLIVFLFLGFNAKIIAQFCDRVMFLKLQHTDISITSQISLVKTFRNGSLHNCMSETLNPLILWFLYDMDSSDCIIGQCWDVLLQEQVTTNQLLYRKRVSVPRSCSAVKAESPDAGDDEYWLYPDAPSFLGCPTKIYCHNMTTTSPLEYISLPVTNTGVYPSKQTEWCEEDTDMVGNRPGTTHFHKMRVYIKTMTVDINDYTFADGTGTKHQYGVAEDCYTSARFDCGPLGTFSIDTSQTGMVVSLQQTWSPFGYEPYNVSMTRSPDGRQIHLHCGGSCGGCEPPGDNLQLHRNSLEVLPPTSAQFVSPK